MELFGKFSASDFFQNYWQKKPMVFKNALEGFVSPLEPDELAGLACEEDIESRLVLEKGGEKPWEVSSGPFSEEKLTALEDSHWSLSVQGVDRILPEISSLLSHFRFIPNWLLDDVMASYAPDQGSVGAHIDNYDVFIIQGQGKRRWLLGGEPQFNEEYQEDLDIRLLKTFEPEHEWELNTGDVLYIPNRFAHHGIAIGECLNYSVGFRSPTEAELVRSLANWSIENEIEEKFYFEPNLTLQNSPGEIQEKSLAAIKAHMKTYIDSPHFNKWFGEHITEPKAFFAPPEDMSLTPQELKQFLSEGAMLIPAEGLKRSWINSKPISLFIEGESIELPREANSELPKLVCDCDSISLENILALSGNSSENLNLWAKIHNKGFFCLS